MTLKKAIREGAFKGALLGGLVVATTCFNIAASIPLNAAEKAMRLGSEQIARPFTERRTYEATLEDKRELLLLGTHGVLNYGVFEREGGSCVSLYYGAYLSAGKFWENTRMHKLEEGKRYQVEVVGNETLGWTLLNASEIK
jgi:hypothetical protein